jgi:hypothetical protein
MDTYLFGRLRLCLLLGGSRVAQEFAEHDRTVQLID